MSQSVATPAGLRRRSGALAVLLAFFLPVAGFAYVRQLRWGIALILAAPVLFFVGGRLGMPTTPQGYYALGSLVLAVILTSLVLAFRFARALPAGAEPRWYNRWYHYIWLALLGALVSNLMMNHRGMLFGYENFRIPSASMQPALAVGDFITVDTRNSAMATIERGDIVTYVPRRYPDQTWIARVVGLPGETIVAKGNTAEINGRRLAETYLAAPQPDDAYPIPFERTTLGASEYFLMGDNRPNADDSRYQGPVDRSALRGKARAIWFSYSPFTHSIDTARIGTLPIAHAK